MAHEILKTMGANTQNTPQMTRARADQVKNSAGGFTFDVSDEQRLLRFLILGSGTGTYYANARDHTIQNVEFIRELARTNGDLLVRTIRSVSVEGRAPKQQPTLYALAVAAASPEIETRRAALNIVSDVCRTGTMLYEFMQYVKNERGWSRMLRSGVGAWYERDYNTVAFQAIKYRQREGWTHRDVLRLSHPTLPTEQHRRLFNFMCGREIDTAVDDVLSAYLRAQKASDKELLNLITVYRLPWEALPSAALNKVEVWEALLPSMGLGALIRNLSRFTRIGLIKPLGVHNVAITSRLVDPLALRKARIHPVQILDALMTYNSGHSTKGNSAWSPVRDIVDALDSAFYASFGAVEPANKRTMLALDVSGSMGWSNVSDNFTARDASAALSLVTAATEPQTYTVAFTGAHYRSYDGRSDVDAVTPLDISPKMRLNQVIDKISNLQFGATDCALPMLHAQAKGIEVDTFVVYTDNETWAGSIHPFQALRQYRHATGINAKLIVCGMTATEFTIADPTDPGMLDVVGFDLNTPQMISGFSRGDF